MPRYIAFLRAINVGGRTIKMAQLRQHFEALGLADVETFINSGNVAFTSKSARAGSLEKKIEAHLLKTLGYEVATFVRSAAELAAIAAYQPFPGTDPAGGRLYIAFTQAPPSAEAQHKLAAAQTQSDQFHVHQREVYWLVQTRFSESLFSGSGKFEKMLGVPATVRNSTTVHKLAAKYPAKRP